jgi:hypothetical protein
VIDAPYFPLPDREGPGVGQPLAGSMPAWGSVRLRPHRGGCAATHPLIPSLQGRGKMWIFSPTPGERLTFPQGERR